LVDVEPLIIEHAHSIGLPGPSVSAHVHEHVHEDEDVHEDEYKYEAGRRSALEPRNANDGDTPTARMESCAENIFSMTSMSSRACAHATSCFCSACGGK
jgi:hypothetical protein